MANYLGLINCLRGLKTVRISHNKSLSQFASSLVEANAINSASIVELAIIVCCLTMSFTCTYSIILFYIGYWNAHDIVDGKT